MVSVAMDRTTGRASGGAERLTQDYADNLTPAISPDSQSIADWNERGLALMDAQGARERVVVDRMANAIGHSPEWRSADEVVTAIKAAGTSRHSGVLRAEHSNGHSAGGVGRAD